MLLFENTTFIIKNTDVYLGLKLNRENCANYPGQSSILRMFHLPK